MLSAVMDRNVYSHGNAVLRRKAWVFRTAIRKHNSGYLLPKDTYGLPPRNTICKDVFLHLW